MPVEPSATGALATSARERDAADAGATSAVVEPAGPALRARFGIVHYLNSWPLAWTFLRRQGPAWAEPVYLPPSRVADGLASGDLEVGLVPSAELQRIPGLAVVPGLCIASQHEVKSVLLVSQVPPERIRRVALDESSRTSAVLVQLLLAERHGVRPEVAPFRPELEAMLATADAALLIGDPALRVDRRGLHVVDLAAEWRALTGLPFVFAVWAVAKDVERELAAREIVPLLERSLAAAEARARRARLHGRGGARPAGRRGAHLPDAALELPARRRRARLARRVLPPRPPPRAPARAAAAAVGGRCRALRRSPAGAGSACRGARCAPRTSPRRRARCR